MFSSKEEYEHYKAVIQIIWDYVGKEFHEQEEERLFLIVVTRLLQHQRITLVSMVDIWEECASYPDYRQRNAFPTFTSAYDTLPPEPGKEQAVYSKKTEPLPPAS